MEPVTKTGFYLNTVISITLYDTTDTSLIDGAFAVCDSYEKLLSRTLEGSDIWNINHSNGTPTTVSAETADLIQTALTYCDITDGSVDITLAPLSDLWDFSSDKPKKVPADYEINALLPNVDYRTVQVQDNVVTLTNKKAAIDLGFIAKGFIADKIKSYLLEQGVTSAVINLGGNVLTIGNKPTLPLEFKNHLTTVTLPLHRFPYPIALLCPPVYMNVILSKGACSIITS